MENSDRTSHNKRNNNILDERTTFRREFRFVRLLLSNFLPSKISSYTKTLEELRNDLTMKLYVYKTERLI